MSTLPEKLPSVLLVEDDPTLSLELVEFLCGDGFAVDSVTGVQEAEQALQTPYDLMVLDLNLPDGNGVEFCGRIRPYVRSGIVVCSGRSERELRLSMLRGGADAFLVKPVDAEELSAVLTSVLRRVTPQAPSPLRASVVPSTWRLEKVQYSLIAPSGKRVSLTTAESLLLETLFSAPDRTADRLQLLEVFERAEMPVNGPRLETLVSRLRAKVFSATTHQLPLRASYGRGYVFKAFVEIC
jgi:DNA-binding response OmpR family regulator